MIHVSIISLHIFFSTGAQGKLSEVKSSINIIDIHPLAWITFLLILITSVVLVAVNDVIFIYLVSCLEVNHKDQQPRPSRSSVEVKFQSLGLISCKYNINRPKYYKYV